MVNSIKRMKWVGEFIRKRREAQGMSQKALGLLFEPAVTTQFISNIERGVTPLPPIHIPTLAKALATTDAELRMLLEKEYSQKLNGRLGLTENSLEDKSMVPSLTVSPPDFEFMKSLYDAYRSADQKTKQAFATVCEGVLKLPKTSNLQ